MKIYMIRHGETQWNRERRLQGQTDIPLNEFGRYLAKETAPAFAQIPFDLVYTSPLKRAVETAQLVMGERKIPFIMEPRIQEICFGDYEGRCWKGDSGSVSDPDFQNFFQAPERYNPPRGGESFLQLSERLDDFLRELFQKKELEDKTVLLSTHGAALCGMLRLMKHQPIEQYWGGGVHRNCAVTIAEEKNGTVRILEEAVTYYKEDRER